jgi:hypothetical protein
MFGSGLEVSWLVNRRMVANHFFDDDRDLPAGRAHAQFTRLNR